MRLSKRGGASWTSSFKATIPDAAPMDDKEFQQVCAKLGINDSLTAAELFGLSWRTCQRYWYNDLKVPGPLARLLRLSVHLHYDADAMRKLFSVSIAHKDTRRKPGTSTMVRQIVEENHGEERLDRTPHRTRRGILSSD